MIDVKARLSFSTDATDRRCGASRYTNIRQALDGLPHSRPALKTRARDRRRAAGRI
jgi:hypothetical protein